jgi:putative membrane protein
VGAETERRIGSPANDVRATDALANERTFLAYARTALAFIGFGFVIAHFSLYLREAAAVAHIKAAPTGISTVFGAGMAAAGVACALYGAYRYVASARALRQGTVLPLSDGAAAVGALVIAVIGAIVALVLPSLR